MTRFSDLFWSRRDLGPAEHQHYLEQQLPRALAEAGFHSWLPGDPICSEGTRFLIGIATYSESDMRLLDLLEAALRETNGKKMRVEVFSIVACRTPEDF